MLAGAFPGHGVGMLRITILDMQVEQRIVLEGKLAEPWVGELESVWEKTRYSRRDRRCVVDLSGTTVIDEKGRRILMVMCAEGARLIAKGVATIQLVKDIKRKCAAAGQNSREIMNSEARKHEF
jgi:hypothetical protein